jgi:hypothetical protein
VLYFMNDPAFRRLTSHRKATSMTQQPQPAPLSTEVQISPLTAAIAASPQFKDFCAANPPRGDLSRTGRPFLEALIAFMASPAGQALEAALIQMILSMLKTP